MEVTIIFPLLLLICSLSTAELQTVQLSNNENISQGEQTESQGRRPANTSDPQHVCPGDIHAVLREMSALLAEQKVEIRHLQRENEAQASHLRELELQKTAQAAQLRELELQKTGLKQQVQAQAAQLGELELQKTGMEKLKQQFQAQSEELTLIKARTNVTENQMEALKGESKAKQVAFSASLLDSGSATVGPFNTHTPLTFKYVVTNIGNAYNPDSGFFLPPVRGVYRFEFYIGAHGHPSHGSAVMLVKNGQHIFCAYEHQTDQYGSSANAATLLLEVGDVVFLKLWSNTRIFDNGNHHSTFSGHLLFTM